MKKTLLIILIILILPTIVSATIQDCVIAINNSNAALYTQKGVVSSQGHFALTNNVNRTYNFGLYCDSTLPTTGDALFYFSDPNQALSDGSLGSGHISITNTPGQTSFSAGLTLGINPDTCRIKSTACNANEFCVFKTTNNTNNQGHIADCNTPNTPMPNNYPNRLCCDSEVEEICDDGIDNSGNGLIDCADPACHPSPVTLGKAQECTGNNQASDDCVSLDASGNPVYSPHCLDASNNAFYCSYGDQEANPEGFCCPAGTRARYDSWNDRWYCEEPTQCGVGNLPQFFCDYDFRTQKGNWFNSVFEGGTDEWCVSRMPDYYNPVDNSESSMGCCFTTSYGGVGFYYKADNVKVFGTE
jgi:hypothetical protein